MHINRASHIAKWAKDSPVGMSRGLQRRRDYQIIRQDFRFLEVEAAALGFALIPISCVHLFDATQLKMMSNQGKVMEILNAYGTAEKTGGAK